MESLRGTKRPHQQLRALPLLIPEHHSAILKLVRAKTMGEEGIELCKEGDNAPQIRVAVEARVKDRSPFLWVEAEDTSAPFQWVDPIAGPVRVCQMIQRSKDTPQAILKQLEIATVSNLRVCLEAALRKQLRNGDTGHEVREGALVSSAEAFLLEAVEEDGDVTRVGLRVKIKGLWEGALKELWNFKHGGRSFVATRYRGRLDLALVGFLRRSQAAFFRIPSVEIRGNPEQKLVSDAVLLHLQERGWSLLSGCGGAGKSFILGQLARSLAGHTIPNEYRQASECPLCRGPLMRYCLCGFEKPVSPCRSINMVFAAPTNRAVAVLQKVLEGCEIGDKVICCTLHALGCMHHKAPVDLLVVDESSMLASEHGDIIVQCEALKRAALLLVGDDLQLTPVGPGELFRPLLRHAQLPCLDKNLRAQGHLQKPIAGIRGGCASHAADFAVRVGDDADRHERILQQVTSSEGTCQVLALRNEDRIKYCCFAVKKHHCVQEDDYANCKQRPFAFKPYVGEPVRFQKNTFKPVACRGSIGVITGVQEDIASQDENNQQPSKIVYVIQVSVGVAGQQDSTVEVRCFSGSIGFELRPAFAITVHDSQGGEFDHVHVLLPPSPSSPLCTLEMLYTAVSRSRSSLTIWSVSKDFSAFEESLARVSPLRATPFKAMLQGV